MTDEPKTTVEHQAKPHGELTMTIKTAIKEKWKKAPKTFEQAKAVLASAHGYACPVCNSTLLLPVIRLPAELWKAHCNSCGSESTIAAMMNRTAWRTLSRWWKRQCTPPNRNNVEVSDRAGDGARS